MDLAAFAGAEYLDATLDGEVFRVGELTLGEWAPVQAWIKAEVPGPLAALRGPDYEGLAPADREAIRRLAYEEARAWPPRVGSKAWFLALDHPGGQAALLRALLAKHRPGISPERCAELAGRLALAEVLPLVLAGLGLFDPKAPTPPATTTTRTARRAAAAGRRATTSAPAPPSSPRRSAGRKKTSSA